MAAQVDTPKIDEDWQLNKSLAECNRHMLENGIGTDVTFLVSDQDAESEVETFSAHKYVLISRSPVFYSMLCGVLAETGQIRVTDINPKAFRQMLNYIYTDDPDLTCDLVPHVINASKKYILPGLTTKCAEFIKDHQAIENVCRILDQILIFEENDLNDICLNLIMVETAKVLESEAFLSISRDTLSGILDIKTCEVKETDVFKACVKWARQKCAAEEKEATGTNIRAILGDCITKFRFSDAGDFARDVCPTGVLTRDEENGVLCHLADRRTLPAPPGFYCEVRLRPIFTVLTSKDIQETEHRNLDFKLTINNYSNNDLKVNTLIIGVGSNISNAFVIYKDENIGGSISNTQDNDTMDFKCITPFIIKRGLSTLELKYFALSNRTTNIVGVPKDTIFLVDCDRIQVQVSARNRFIPLLGLSCQLVIN